MGRAEPCPVCNEFDEPLTVRHILVNCPVYHLAYVHCGFPDDLAQHLDDCSMQLRKLLREQLNFNCAMLSTFASNVFNKGSGSSFLDYEQLVKKLQPGDIIEIRRGGKKHWALYEQEDFGLHLCYHVKRASECITQPGLEQKTGSMIRFGGHETKDELFQIIVKAIDASRDQRNTVLDIIGHFKEQVMTESFIKGFSRGHHISRKTSLKTNDDCVEIHHGTTFGCSVCSDFKKARALIDSNNETLCEMDQWIIICCALCEWEKERKAHSWLTATSSKLPHMCCGQYSEHEVVDLMSETCIVARSPLKTLMTNWNGITFRARVNNQEKLAHELYLKSRNVDVITHELSFHIGQPVPFDDVRLNSEHYVTMWKYGRCWSSEFVNVQNSVTRDTHTALIAWILKCLLFIGSLPQWLKHMSFPMHRLNDVSRQIRLNERSCVLTQNKK